MKIKIAITLLLIIIKKLFLFLSLQNARYPYHKQARFSIYIFLENHSRNICNACRDLEGNSRWEEGQTQGIPRDKICSPT